MLTLPIELRNLMIPFAPLFSKRVFHHAHILVMGALLATGKRTVTRALRVCGLRHSPQFQNYHRVLNRAVWSGRHASRMLLLLLVATFAVQGPLVFGVDDTIERRRGKKIRAKGIYRDPVRSSQSHFVKASGLRWLSVMLLAPIPWAQRVWALPFLTVLAPSERYYHSSKRAPKALPDWARQLLLQVGRWLPHREKVVVGDSSFAAIELLASVRASVHVVTRLRLDAGLYEPAPPRPPGQNGRPRVKGARLPQLTDVLTTPDTVWTRVTVQGWYGVPQRHVDLVSATAVWYHPGLPPLPLRWVLVRDPEGKFAPQAFLCTKLGAEPVQILEWFVMRWQVEVTFAQARAHLGMETQRQWNDAAIARTTPVILGLYAMVTLLAHRLIEQHACPVSQTAWYAKTQPTFSDTLALVRRYLWGYEHFSMSPSDDDSVKVPRVLFERLTDTLCYAV